MAAGGNTGQHTGRNTILPGQWKELCSARTLGETLFGQDTGLEHHSARTLAGIPSQLGHWEDELVWVWSLHFLHFNRKYNWHSPAPSVPLQSHPMFTPQWIQACFENRASRLILQPPFCQNGASKFSQMEIWGLPQIQWNLFPNREKAHHFNTDIDRQTHIHSEKDIYTQTETYRPIQTYTETHT